MLRRLAKFAHKTLFSCTSSSTSIYSSTSTLSASDTALLKKRSYSSESLTMTTSVNTSDRLQQLRKLMADPKYNVTAYVVPSEDAHQVS